MALIRQTNFATRTAPPVGIVAWGIWLLVTLVLAALLWTWATTVGLYREQEKLSGHMDRLTAQIGTALDLAENAPSANAIASQSAQIIYFNGLTGPRAVPLVTLLRSLEGDLPVDVWVSQMNYSVETGLLSLSLQAGSEGALPPALKSLEAAPALRSVILERQIRVQQGSRNLVQYDIRAQTS